MNKIFKTKVVYFLQNNFFSVGSITLNHLSIIDIIIYILLLIQIVVNIIGLIIIKKSTAKFRFEIIILISGIIECTLNFGFNFLNLTFFSVCVQFCHTVITLYITEKFLKLYYLLNETSNSSKLYNCLFVWLVLINFLLCIIVLLIDLKNNYKDYEINIELGNNIFGFLCGLTLFILGLKLNGEIVDKLTTETQHKNKEINEENNEIEMMNNNSYFFKTRKKQLLIIIYANLLTATIELISCAFRKYFYIKMINNTNYNGSPYKNYYEILLKLEEFSFWIESFSNFFAFFFLIRKGFYNKNKTSINNPELKDLMNKDRNYSIADIDDYIG